MTAVKFYEYHSSKVIALCLDVGDTRKSDKNRERNVDKQSIKMQHRQIAFPPACLKLIMGHVGILCLVIAINKFYYSCDYFKTP